MHLERMGDLALNIAKAARRTAGRRGPQTLYDLIQAQGNLVHRVLEATLEALANNDLELARKLPELDEPIDHLFKQFFRELARLQAEEDIEWASSMVLAARYLERIADNSVDIGERLQYLLTGTFEPIEHQQEGKAAPDATDGAGEK
jgi:phosphate transport system protein